MMSANKTIDLSKYRYVYYVDSGELYELDGWRSLGRYSDIGGLVGYEVKCWKPFKVNRICDQLAVDKKNGKDVYLGVNV